MSALLTIDDILSDPRYKRGELWDGRFVVKEPSGGTAPCVGASLLVALASLPGVRTFGRLRDASAGYVVARDPDRVLSPHVSLVSFACCPILPEVGFVEGAPELAVEVRSPRDSWLSVVEKGGVWIGHGARLVWCVDPRARTVLVLRPGDEPQEHAEGSRLDLRPLLGAHVSVDDLFAGI